MRVRQQQAPSSSKFRLRSTSSRTLAFRVSHSRPAAWQGPGKDGDDHRQVAPQPKQHRRDKRR